MWTSYAVPGVCCDREWSLDYLMYCHRCNFRVHLLTISVKSCHLAELRRKKIPIFNRSNKAKFQIEEPKKDFP